MANVAVSPDASGTNPASDVTSRSEPVLAFNRPARAGVSSRRCSVPVRPATARPSPSGDVGPASSSTRTSWSQLIRLPSSSPEPSVTAEPSASSPSASARDRTTARPASVVPASPATRPSSFTSSSPVLVVAEGQQLGHHVGQRRPVDLRDRGRALGRRSFAGEGADLDAPGLQQPGEGGRRGQRRAVGPSTQRVLVGAELVVVAVVDREGAQRAGLALGDVALRPGRHRTGLVVAGLVAHDPAGHDLHAGRRHPVGELVERRRVGVVAGAPDEAVGVGRQERVAVADQVEVADDGTVDRRGRGHDARREAVVGAELVERDRGGEELLVGRRYEGRVGGALVQRPPVDPDRQTGRRPGGVEDAVELFR